jgi:hypothetical protein
MGFHRKAINNPTLKGILCYNQKTENSITTQQFFYFLFSIKTDILGQKKDQPTKLQSICSITIEIFKEKKPPKK